MALHLCYSGQARIQALCTGISARHIDILKLKGRDHTHRGPARGSSMSQKQSGQSEA